MTKAAKIEQEIVKEYVEKQHFIKMLETYKKTLLQYDPDEKMNNVRVTVANELIDLIETMEASYRPI